MAGCTLFEHHEIICDFLGTIDSRSYLQFLPAKNLKPREMLEQIIQSEDGLLHYSDFNGPLEGLDTEALSKIRSSLNAGLQDFSHKYGIKPAIKLYFRTKGDKSPGGHFACCDIDGNLNDESNKFNPAVSQNFISSNILKEDLRNVEIQIKNRYPQNSDILNNKYNVGIDLDNNSIFPFITIEERLEKKPGCYPCLEDLTEGGSYYRNDNYHDDIITKLENNKQYLIQSNPGTGKTSLALAIGYEFLEKGCSVYYYDATFVSDTDKLEHFIQSCNEDCVVIFDNAHHMTSEINKLITKKHKAMFLIAARQVSEHLTFSRPIGNTHHISYPKVFEKEGLVMNLEMNCEMILHIIGQHVDSQKINADKIGNIDLIIKRCQGKYQDGGNYNILRFYIEAWKNNHYQNCLSAVEEKDMLAYVYSHYLQDNTYLEDLLKISVLTQYEIKVDSKWIGNNLNEILKDGLVLSSVENYPESGKYFSWLHVFHPTVAQYFLKAAVYCGTAVFESIEEFSLQCIQDYLLINPYNFFEIFKKASVLYNNQSCSPFLTDKLLEQSKDLLEISTDDYLRANEQDIKEYLCFIKRVGYCEKNGLEALFDLLIERIYNTNGDLAILFGSVCRLKNELGLDISFNKDTANLWFRGYGKKIIKNNEFLPLVAMLLDDLLNAGIDEKYINEMIGEIDYSMLGRMNARQNPTHLSIFLQSFSQIKSENKKLLDFCNELDFQKLGRLAWKSGKNEIYEFEYFITPLIASFYSNEVPKEKLKIFFEEFDFGELGILLQDNPGFWENIFIFVTCAKMSGLPKSGIDLFWNKIDFKLLAKTAKDEEVDWANLLLFYLKASRGGVPKDALLDFYNELDFSGLGKQVSNEELDCKSLYTFIIALISVGIPNDKIIAYLGQLNYQLLGQRTRSKADYLCALELVTVIRLTGLSQTLMVPFYNELLFEEFGKQLRNYSDISKTAALLESISEAGVSREKQISFCEQIDFVNIAEHFCESDYSFEELNRIIRFLVDVKFPQDSFSDFLGHLDFKIIGQKAQKNKTCFANIYLFSNDILDADTSKDKLLNFYNELDLAYIGKTYHEFSDRILGAENSIMQKRFNPFTCAFWFIRDLLNIGVEKNKILAFGQQLDFRKLGEVAKVYEIDWLSVTQFIGYLSQINISQKMILDFYGQLDRDKLITHIKAEINSELVYGLIEIVSWIGLPSSDIEDICMQLDFKELGFLMNNKMEDFLSVQILITSCLEIGCPPKDILVFCEQLNFWNLGRLASKDPAVRETIAPFLNLMKSLGVPSHDLNNFRTAIIYSFSFRNMVLHFCKRSMEIFKMSYQYIFSFFKS